MVHFPLWKTLLVSLVCLIGVIYALPNVLDRDLVEEWAEEVPSWLPVKQVNLGLDLRGGSHILLEVGYEAVLQERLEGVADGLRAELRRQRIGFTQLGEDLDSASVGLTLRDRADWDRLRPTIFTIDEQLRGDLDGDRVTVTFPEDAIDELRDAAVQQTIEIVRRRIDELGTNEPNIQRQGLDRVLVQLPGVDDPERIKELLGRTARLTFHLVDNTVTTADRVAGRVPPGTILLPSNETTAEGEPFTTYPVRRRVIVSGEQLTNAAPTFQQGQPVVAFTFDTAGGRRFGEVTSENVGQALAIVLDDQVISAPVIRSPILGGRGIIEGGFSVQTANDLSLLLRAGALPAPLTVLEERTVGPGLGADSIAAGQIASLIGFIGVIVFMALAYGRFGLYANVALTFNLALILAVLSALQATLTLPGIAGIVLTVGMAVDANVLIFERIREERRNGRTPISAIDAGYARALTTIIDSNLTTLIAAILLFAVGSGPIQGFAVTLAVGIMASMFTAIMVTRMQVVLWLRAKRPSELPL